MIKFLTMDTTYENVSVHIVDDSGVTKPHIQGDAKLSLNYDPAGLSAKVHQGMYLTSEVN